MKNVLALTDFSENAVNAAKAALVLSGKLKANLILFNTYLAFPAIDAYAGGPWILDEYANRRESSKETLDLLTEGLESLALQLEPDDRKPAIKGISGDADLGLSIEEIATHKDVEMIVMGARSAKESGKPFFGHDTNAVIEHAACPVLVVPAGSDFSHIFKVIFATDFGPNDMEAIRYLVKLAKLFSYRIEVVHVAEPGEAKFKSAEQTAFEKQLARLRYPQLSYHVVNGKDLVNRLKREAGKEKAGMIAMLHHQHSFFVRLLEHSETKEALSKQDIPLLIFPSK